MKDVAPALRTPEQIGLMRKAGLIVCEILDELEAATKPGVTTFELDRLAEKLIAKHGAKPAFKGYQGFPCVLCASVNEEIVHGIPSKQRVLRDGDLMKLDFGVSYKGWFGDSARTVPVGAISEDAKRLIAGTRASLEAAIKVCVTGKRIGDIGFAVQSVVDPLGFTVAEDFCGHGIGQALHESPQVPNRGEPDSGLPLKPGMTIAIEPMINLGTAKVEVLDDDWTAVTLDRKISAHFEHTVLITDGAPEVLTRRA